ncbi:MAG TPA: hypothetical protein VFB90_09295, partial [Dehalococcoidia bacterium]|nr:hypothetical protein [Dehalococcoidia bacterium]
MGLSTADISELAAALTQAESARAPIAPLTARYPEMGQEDAYAVQRVNMAAKITAGAKLVGWKVGLTSKAMQEMFGVDTPDFGQLLDFMIQDSGSTISREVLIQPRIEPEIAFILSADLQGPGVSLEDVLAATEAVLPSLEIIDSRIADWKIKLPDTIADNASCGRVILGRERVVADSLDLSAVQMTFRKDGEDLSQATGAAVLGNPANAVAWLANTLGQFGEKLK